MNGPTVLHVVASRERRGAEIFAADLVRAVRGEGLRQRVAVLRDGRRDVEFEAEVDVLGGGRSLPAVRMNAGAVRSLARLLERHRPGVVLAHGGEALKHAAVATLGRAPRTIVYRRIGATPPWMAGRARRAAYALLMRRAGRIVAVAESVRRELLRDPWIPAERVLVIPNGVDVGRLTPNRGREETRRALGLPEDAPVVLSVGALNDEKDPLGHLAVARRVLDAIPHARYVVAGDGPLRASLRSAADRAGLGARVQVLGSRPDVPDLMAAADALLLASATEGMPAVAIEAGMLALPVAAWAIGGVPEVVTDGETGVLAPRGDVEGLAEGVTALLLDPGRRRATGSAARDRCASRFEIGIVARAYLRVFEEVASSSAPSPWAARRARERVG